ncbi:hypothetical protein ACHWQZ_G000445 [Mnemiopsis leidyi]
MADSFFGINLNSYCGEYDDSSKPDDFSICFEDSYICWIVCIITIIIGNFYMALAKNSPYSYRWLRPWFISSIVIGITSLIPQFIIIGTIVQNDLNVPVLKWNATIIIITTAFVLFVTCYERTKGNVSSFPVWTFWALMTLYSIVRIRTLAASSWQAVEDLHANIPVLIAVYSGIVLLNLIVHSIQELPDELLYKQKEELELEDNHRMKYDRPDVDTRKPCPEEYVPFGDFIFFHWLTKIIWKGFRRPLEDKDLYHVPNDSKTENIIDNFFKSWTGSKPCPKGTTACKNKDNLIMSLVKFNWKWIVAAVILKLANDLLTFVPPQILKRLIHYMLMENLEPDTYDVTYGVVFCVLMAGALILQTICIQAYFDKAINTGMKIRVALVAAIYRKSLLLSNAGQKSSQLGQMINLMQVDAQKFQEIFTYINMLWSAPLQIILAMYLLYQELGESTFVGLSVTIIMLPFNSVLMGKMHGFQQTIMKITDQRVRKTNEVLDGIKVIKLYGWEDSFLKEVDGIREKELSAMKSRIKFGVIITFIWTCSPILVSLLSFLCYSLLGEDLTSEKAFVSLTLFNILRFPLVMLPNMITQLIQARVSIIRIKDFLALPELEADSVIHGDSDSPDAVEIKGGKFSWDQSDKDNLVTLDDINVTVPRGKLVAIVGAVGSGKSSLVSAMLGEMDKLEGDVYLNGSVSYVPQVSWVLNDSLKNNILFGAEWNKCYYKEVIVNCALETDLQILPNGDATEIGEKGINLSGGQKQRVSLARAIYNKNDIYVFDDPLSAVDAHVGKHLFEKVIGPRGMINDKTRILVTHKLSVLPEVDHVIVLKDGKVLEQGTYNDLMSKDSELHRLVSSYEPDQDETEDKTEVEDLESDSELGDLPVIPDVSVKKSIRRRKSRLSREESTCSIKGNNNAGKDEKLIEEEKVEKGNISFKTYADYLKYMGATYATITLISFVLQNGSQLGSSLWLSEWSNANDNAKANKEDPNLFLYLGIYALLGLLQTVFVLGFVFAILYASIRASSQIHSAMFARILRVPMSFFDTTPLGRILNRFSKDMNTIDERLPNSMRSFVNILGTVTITLITIGIMIPIMIAIFIPIALLYLAVQRLYIPTSRQLKRLESVSRSPIYNQFGETLMGLPSIRAYGKKENFIKYNQGLVDDNVRSFYLNMMSNRWLSTRLEITGHCVIFLSALISVLQAKSMDAAQAGLAISSAMGVTQALSWVVRMYSELEVNVVSVERVNEYSELATERALVSSSPPPGDWPQKGRIEYKDVSVRYREGLDLVLRNLTFSITAGERIGIVGRTGAGKSSITLTLFRILELAEGAIIIDGVDISAIGLHELRKKISIIPQDPILFSDTIRKNLDPFETYNDDQIWPALESASLKKFFEQQEKGLDFLVQEGGSNLSVGQRQLVCLARALLSDNKIIVMDEATAAVDIETDSVIQDAIRETFAGRTILTIAHRLNTIIDYDRILVLDKGEIAEFGSAAELKQNQGIFYSMLNDAGLLQTVPQDPAIRDILENKNE